MTMTTSRANEVRGVRLRGESGSLAATTFQCTRVSANQG